MRPREYYNYTNGRYPKGGGKSLWWLPLALVILLSGIAATFHSCGGEDGDTSPSLASGHPIGVVEQGWHTVLVNGTQYKVLDQEYAGDYDLQTLRLPAAEDADSFRRATVLSAEDYRAFCDRWSLTPAFAAHPGRYAVLACAEPQTKQVEVQLCDVRVTDGVVHLLLRDAFTDAAQDGAAYVLTVPVDADVTALETESVYTADDVASIR